MRPHTWVSLPVFEVFLGLDKQWGTSGKHLTPQSVEGDDDHVEEPHLQGVSLRLVLATPHDQLKQEHASIVCHITQSGCPLSNQRALNVQKGT